MKLKLKDVLINPNRDLVRNPFNEEKLAKLTASINKTGFWDNVVVRKNKAGKYEMAYGHHRVEAAKRAGVEEADFIVKNFSDTEMIKVMKDENDEAYGFSAASLLESVRAVVNALAEGRIEPFKIDASTNKSSIRYAPSFLLGEAGRSPAHVAYTALSVAEFLGETLNRGERGESKPRANESIVVTLNALALIETQELSEASLKGLPLDGGKNGNGLIQKVQKKTKDREDRIAREADRAERCTLDEAVRAVKKKEKEADAELLRIQKETLKAETEADAKQWAEERRVAAERAAERLAKFRVERAGLDAKVRENQERAEDAQQRDKALPTRHAAASCIGKLATIVSERNAFREDLKSLGRDKALTQAERERIRQGLLDASEWYAEQAIQFRPVVTVDVLKEARRKEASKHKREESV